METASGAGRQAGRKGQEEMLKWQKSFFVLSEAFGEIRPNGVIKGLITHTYAQHPPEAKRKIRSITRVLNSP